MSFTSSHDPPATGDELDLIAPFAQQAVRATNDLRRLVAQGVATGETTGTLLLLLGGCAAGLLRSVRKRDAK